MVALSYPQAELTHLSQVRAFVAEAVRALGAPEAMADDFVLAVDECVTNVVEHGYAGRAGAVTVEVERAGAVIVVRVRDAAPSFDPLQLPDPDLSRPLEERPIGGLGVYLVRRLMDAVSYRIPPQGGNELTLLKHLSAAV